MDVLVVTEDGYGKRTAVEEYPVKDRGGPGSPTIHPDRAPVADALLMREDDDVLVFASSGSCLRINADQIPCSGPRTKGVKLLDLAPGGKVVAVAAAPPDGVTATYDQPLCSFCGKTEAQVNRLVAGPGVYICDECVRVALEIIEDDDSVENHTS